MKQLIAIMPGVALAIVGLEVAASSALAKPGMLTVVAKGTGTSSRR